MIGFDWVHNLERDKRRRAEKRRAEEEATLAAEEADLKARRLRHKLRMLEAAEEDAREKRERRGRMAARLQERIKDFVSPIHHSDDIWDQHKERKVFTCSGCERQVGWLRAGGYCNGCFQWRQQKYQLPDDWVYYGGELQDNLFYGILRGEEEELVSSPGRVPSLTAQIRAQMTRRGWRGEKLVTRYTDEERTGT